MACAWYFISNKKSNNVGHRCTSRQFEYAKVAFNNSRFGKNHHFYQKSLSESHKSKIRESLLGYKQSTEHVKKRANAIKGEQNPMYGVDRKTLICPHCDKLGGPRCNAQMAL